MEEQNSIREIKINIENEFVLNLVAYLTSEENYVFVGNEKELWLENLDHPKVQLIYINDQKRWTEAHASYITRKIVFISGNIKRKFWMPRVNALVLNVEGCDGYINDTSRNISFVNVDNANAVYENQLLGRLFPRITTTNLSASVIELATKLQHDTKKRATQDIELSKIKTKPIVTHVYVGLLIAVCVFLLIRLSDLPTFFVAIHYGATFSPLIVAGDYWRLFSATFMHLDLLHLVFNAMFIYRFGVMLEGVIGKWRMVFVIIMSSFIGSLFGFAFSPTYAVGASGVAYGFLGVLLFLGFEMRKMFMPIIHRLFIPMIIASVLVAFFVPNIDHFGHLGGFIGGFLAATIVGVPKIKPFIFRSLLTSVTLVILISGLWIRGVRLTEEENFDPIHRELIIQYIELGQIDHAMRIIEENFDPTDLIIQFIELGQIERAERLIDILME